MRNKSPAPRSLSARVAQKPRMPLRQFRARVRMPTISNSWSTESASSTLAGSRVSPRRPRPPGSPRPGRNPSEIRAFGRGIRRPRPHWRHSGRSARRRPPPAPAGRAPSAGNRARSGFSKVSVAACARSSRAAGPSIRCGQARQCAIGMRMSGLPSWAISEPSRNSTRPCTIDCGWTRTSISSGGARTDDAPRSLRGPCSSASPNRS